MKEKIKKLLRSKVFNILIVIIIFFVGLKLYTNYISNLFDNSTPQKAIAEYVYNINSTYKVFFMKIEEVHSEEIEKNNECNYYMITQSIIGKPNNMGGTFKVKKIDNFYYVTSYDNMPR